MKNSKMKNKGFIKGVQMGLTMVLGITLFGIWLGYDIVRSGFYSLEYDECIEIQFPEYSHDFGDFGFFAKNCIKEIEKMSGVRRVVNGNPDIRVRVWVDKNSVSKQELQNYLNDACSTRIKDDEQWENF